MLKYGFDPNQVAITKTTMIDQDGFSYEYITKHSNNNVWVRPSDWPNIDALASRLSDDDECVYLTYDLRKTPGYGWIGVVCTLENDTGTWTVERGHISSGTFVTDAKYDNQTSGAPFRMALDDTNGEVQLWRIKSNDHVTTFYFCANSDVDEECYTAMV